MDNQNGERNAVQFMRDAYPLLLSNIIAFEPACAYFVRVGRQASRPYSPDAQSDYFRISQTSVCKFFINESNNSNDNRNASLHFGKVVADKTFIFRADTGISVSMSAFLFSKIQS